jgi:hypothetical protein
MPCFCFYLRNDLSVNTAARMESNGQSSRIHVSEKTAELIRAAGKSHWVSKREDLVSAKGKGKLQTYWIEPRKGGANSIFSDIPSGGDDILMDAPDIKSGVEPLGVQLGLTEKQARMVDWNAALLGELLSDVVAHRKANGSYSSNNVDSTVIKSENGLSLVRDEIQETICLPAFDNSQTIDKTELSLDVISQLRSYVTAIAASYPDNAFHNFAHASHVAMSAHKLLQGLAHPRAGDDSHDKIVLDPLTQFAVTFSALVLDVDHPGVPNGQLVKEGSALAARYQNQSIAEHNSVDIAWNLLMNPSFADLQRSIFSNTAELQHFRQVLVNTVMATDIFDEDIKAQLESKWIKAFGEKPAHNAKQQDLIDRKATTIIELISQASNVSHAMQHWYIYLKWNKSLFQEMYRAFKHGRLEENPAGYWYERELRSLDNYVIPLASKVHHCNAFGGVDEFLQFATDNRAEWSGKGREIVAEWIQEEENEYPLRIDI